MKLSIIIVNYNVRYFLEQCIDSCLRAMNGREMELIVVDNKSTDGSREMMTAKFPEIAYHYLDENIGFSRGNNFGIERAKGEHVLLLNPDTVVGESTFQRCVDFMDSHADAGGLGVYMVDGKGNFLPESKRGLPTPKAAFYKMTGLSALWPKSERFGSYHLGYLNKNEVHDVQILSGAFMLIRKKVLEQIGLLDEDFFMYGEDIDLSYRIVKGGYKNYYFPETKIIHYKGESTKKSSANYVFVFYRAMVIFAQKHFTKGQASALSVFINLAIYFRAFLALVSRVIGRHWQLLLDAVIAYTVFVGATNWYGEQFGKDFNLPFITMALPAYVGILCTTLLYGGGYDKPYRLGRILISWVVGVLLLLAFYALLPESYRFSRAIILIGSSLGLLFAIGWRSLFHLLPFVPYSLTSRSPERRLVVSDGLGFARITKTINALKLPNSFTAGVSAKQGKFDLPIDFVATLDELNESCKDFQSEEVIFDADDISFDGIIEQVSNEKWHGGIFKIASQNGSLLIGNKSVLKAGENEISNPLTETHLQRVFREKRTLDLAVALVLLVLSPIMVLFVDRKLNFIQNLYSVLIGKRTWVGYDTRGRAQNLPALKAGVIHKNIEVIWPENQRGRALRSNWNYISSYRPQQDIETIWQHLHHLGA